MAAMHHVTTNIDATKLAFFMIQVFLSRISCLVYSDDLARSEIPMESHPPTTVVVIGIERRLAATLPVMAGQFH